MADPEIDNINSNQNDGDNIFVTTMDHPGTESVASNVYETPNGTRYWTPIVPHGVKPFLKARFNTIEQAIAMYEAYAQLAGFGTRLGTSKKVKIGNEIITTRRYVLCSRAPVNKHKHKETNPDDIDSTSPSRRSNVKVTDCKACVKFRRIKKSTDYEIYGFVEQHNHGFTSPENLDLSLKRRKLDFSTQEFIAKCRNANLGPTKSHKLHVAIKGGHHNVHGTVVDYKNCGRDIRDFIGDRDAQMIIDKFKARSENRVNYSFDTHIDDMELQLIFWCDGVSKLNYEAFGDVLAFDATYDMIFVPFTGVDHHKKCTIFGAGLLHNETIESYTWLLQKFLQAHNGKQPLLILTDQDCAMKQAVANIKGNDKRNAEIKKKFHKLVWNVYIKPETFEKRWHLLIAEYGLQEHSWLTEMYLIREQWIPGYFREIPMCTLMKTTSRCESANHLFKSNSSPHNTLVQFMLCYDTSVDGLRNDQRELSHQTDTTNPEYKTKWPIERHANAIYTRKVFFDVQKEIVKGKENSYIAERSILDGVNCFVIAHQDQTSEVLNEFKVTFNKEDLSVTCKCMGFTRNGYLCRHVFCVLGHHNIHKIPSQYIHPRWRRDAIPSSVYSIDNRLSIDQSSSGRLWRNILENLEMCRDRVRGKIDKLEELDAEVQALKDRIFAEVPYDPEINKKDVVYQEILSHAIPEALSCTAPKKIRNKGCGKHKRQVGAREIAIKKFKKKRRKCSVCGKRVRKHDKRNCPTKKGKPTKDDSSTEEVEEEEDDDDSEYDEEDDNGTDGEGDETGNDGEGDETGTNVEDNDSDG
ncbi:protein FAR1-RELATED SEQUENCE 5-like [Helianthus annuus]|uniref:protein FAR1-RELATED SEQUENCE 5-like n=1 Tax=Helianthus annuus TaxID=4232 RepID=UPI001652C906|nr:protein FAR1-RELATED SEQUENCE 5-like [Helianthus annuus]XP_035838156.1 protein FAR1-RELATED SEQUENCE 5-like [Helianthus annuus]